jgi:demethylmenaquinone methyltransferase/2-methoxy-6-polyprenyl-1,4-benzoquinol methylase
LKGRRPGLQGRWRSVVDSLESIIPVYETGSHRIALFSDDEMRTEVVLATVRPGSLVLDLGSGPGSMSKFVSNTGGVPVLLDVSRKMLLVSAFSNKVQGVFEHLPFRLSTFDSVVAGFSLRDSRDLLATLDQLRLVIKKNGIFSFCDLGKPKSKTRTLALSLYLMVIPRVVGLLTAGTRGLKFGSLYSTFTLAPNNDQLRRLLELRFDAVTLRARRLGGAIVVVCRGSRIS